MYKTRTTCRLCSGNLTTVLDLGLIHVSSFIDTADQATPKIPIELTECDVCKLMQLRHTVDGDVMYREYWYQSGLNSSMVSALKDVVDCALARVTLENNDVIVDIGANDGTLLRQYPSRLKSKIWSVGYEPSNVGKLAMDSCNILISDYFNAKNYPFENKAKIITSVAMFYDLEDPHIFIEDVKAILHQDGIWIIQMMDLVSMLRTNDFPNLCHEHLEYYSLDRLVRLMNEHGLVVFDCEYNSVNGSSLRVYIAKPGSQQIKENLHNALEAEEYYFDNLGDSPANHFRAAIESVRDKVVREIRNLTSMAKTVAVLGASTKGNTILQYFELTERDIIHAAEINPDKFGKRTVGSNIPIIPQHDSLIINPDYYLILPWGFLPNFLEKFDEYLRQGGAFIVPLPEPVIFTFESDIDGLMAWPL